jgi:hypothetical protein
MGAKQCCSKADANDHCVSIGEYKPSTKDPDAYDIAELPQPLSPKTLSNYRKGSGDIPTDSSLPVLVFDRFDARSMEESSLGNLKVRLKHLLLWAEPLIPYQLRMIEIRSGSTADSFIPDLFPAGPKAYENVAEIIEVHAGRSAIGHSITAEKALVCGGCFEELMYPCHDLLRDGVKEVGFVPQLCGTSTRSGALLRPNVSSHLEEVLGVVVQPSLKHAIEWLIPGGGQELPHPSFSAGHQGAKIVVESEDGTVLDDEQEVIVRLLFDDDVSEVKLKKLGKGFSAAQKFFVTPTISKKGTQATGSMTFIKMGEENEIEEELRVTQHMMQLLGVFCPQVLGYSELGEVAVLHLSLVNLHPSGPRGFADLYTELLAQGLVADISSSEQGRTLAARIQTAIEFVFSHLVPKLHASKATATSACSVANELGLCKDCGGAEGTEEGLHMSSAWVLEKLWRKKPGDGGLASSVKIHIALTLGEKAAQAEMLNIPPLGRVPNVCSFLENKELISKLRVASTFEIRRCFVHGDLHGDNIMVDGSDNRFLIDFGKTSLGHALEDVSWLEAFIMLSYTDFTSDEELEEALHVVPALAPPRGLTVESCDGHAMQAALKKKPEGGRMAAMWAVVKGLRAHLGHTMLDVAAATHEHLELEKQRCSIVAALLGLRNALFFLGARENKEAPRRRRFALALACSYAQSLQALID